MKSVKLKKYAHKFNEIKYLHIISFIKVIIITILTPCINNSCYSN